MTRTQLEQAKRVWELRHLAGMLLEKLDQFPPEPQQDVYRRTRQGREREAPLPPWRSLVRIADWEDVAKKAGGFTVDHCKGLAESFVSWLEFHKETDLLRLAKAVEEIANEMLTDGSSLDATGRS